MGILIDASTIIEHERGRLDLERHIAQQQRDALFLSVVTVSELLHGLHRATAPDILARRSMFVESMIQRLTLLPIDLATARIHARIWAQLAAKGVTIGSHDLWLAAACLQHGLTMVSANVRDFRRIPELPVESWTNEN